MIESDSSSKRAVGISVGRGRFEGTTDTRADRLTNSTTVLFLALGGGDEVLCFFGGYRPPVHCGALRPYAIHSSSLRSISEPRQNHTLAVLTVGSSGVATPREIHSLVDFKMG